MILEQFEEPVNYIIWCKQIWNLIERLYSSFILHECVYNFIYPIICTVKYTINHDWIQNSLVCKFVW